MEGIIVINKPKGPTSFDCVAIVRKLSGVRRCGHTGTLDPGASGVLPVCIGRATKLIEYMDGKKKYLCKCRLGIETDSQDLCGEITGGARLEPGLKIWPEQKELEEALESFVGEVEQVPPIYSAIRVKGKRLYEYAREGCDVEIPSRRVIIHSAELISYDRDEGELIMEIHCSAGTYMRTLCSDLGKKLGVGGVMADLVRLYASGFDIACGVELERLKSMSKAELSGLLLPLEKCVGELGKLGLDERRAKLFLNGNPGFARGMDVSGFSPGENIAVFGEGLLLGIAELRIIDGREVLRPSKVLG